MLRLKINITGVSQGIGFRPFLYQIAQQYQLTGHVHNSQTGVCLYWQGNAAQIDQALIKLKQFLKPYGNPHLEVLTLAPIIEQHFEIKSSVGQGQIDDTVSIDRATCQACLDEFNDSTNRRYQYLFNSCAQCEPRFSILDQLPFDRNNTAMQPFSLCTQCQSEYQDPRNRRFHAETISCPACGPTARLIDHRGVDYPITDVLKFLKQGKIVAIKGVGGFHLVTTLDPHAIKRLRTLKNRPHKPLALMVNSVKQALTLSEMSPTEQAVFMADSAPIVLVKQKKQLPQVAEGLDHYGLIRAYTPLHHWLNVHLGPLVVTSGNLSKEPICYQDEMALKLPADYYLLHNRQIIHPLEDSIVQVIAKKPRIIRKARGFIPDTLPALSDQTLLAAGGY